MSYPVFLGVALLMAGLLATAVAGPLSVFCVVGFWVAHYLFVRWNLESASLRSMSDSQLQDLLRAWTARGFSRYSSPHLSHVRRSGNQAEIKKALRRIVAIYDELIVRCQKTGINVDDYLSARDELAEQLAN